MAKENNELFVENAIHGTTEALGDTYMSQRNCEMIVNILNPGVMDIAVAFPKGSKLR